MNLAPMSYIIFHYSTVLFFAFITLLFSFVLTVFSYWVAYQRGNVVKNSAYECGFDAFSDARIKFEIQYYLIALSFLIFDIEVILVLPGCIVLHELRHFPPALIGTGTSSLSFFVCIFILLLIAGYFYESMKRAFFWRD